MQEYQVLVAVEDHVDEEVVELSVRQAFKDLSEVSETTWEVLEVESQ